MTKSKIFLALILLRALPALAGGLNRDGHTVDRSAIGSGGSFNRYRLVPTVFSRLPECSPDIEGMSRPVVDSTTNARGATITGGGTLHVLAQCNGSRWVVIAK